MPERRIEIVHPIFQDQFDNVTGEQCTGKIEIRINKTPSTDEFPMLQGNVQKTDVPLESGIAVVQNLSIQENTQGKDGQEYVLSFTAHLNGRRQTIPPFNLPFLFYNGKFNLSEFLSLIVRMC